MPRRDADWKNQARQYVDWATVLVAVGVVLSFLYAWWQTANATYAGAAGVALAWLGLYFTPYWQPIVYLLVATILVPYVGLLLWRGSWALPATRTAIVLTVLFTCLLVFLFVREERPRQVE